MNLTTKEEKEIILLLLIEYSDKLQEISEKIQLTRKNWLSLTLLISLAYFFMIMLFFTNTIMLFYFSLIYIIVVTFLFLSSLQKKRILNRRAKHIYTCLKKLIDLTSTIESHIITNQILKIELDLRLTDAELAVENYTEIKKFLVFRN